MGPFLAAWAPRLRQGRRGASIKRFVLPARQLWQNQELSAHSFSTWRTTAPWYGSRQMARHLRRNGWCVGRHRVRRLMLKMGLAPIYQRPKTSEPHPQHRTWPYLLRHLTIDRPNQVWCADVTYIPMRRGFLYLVAIMDWFSRKVLGGDYRTQWMLTSASRRWRRRSPASADLDLQRRSGLQFTSFAFTNTLKGADIRISMDRRGRWMDNVLIERLWRSLKYERLHLNAFQTGSEARTGIGRWFAHHNADRPRLGVRWQDPDEVYATQANEERLAA